MLVERQAVMEDGPGRRVSVKRENEDSGIVGGRLASWNEPAAREEEFERIFMANYRRVSAVLSRIVGDPSRAEDLAIETFWRFYRQGWARRAGDDSDGQKPGGWLYRTASRLGIDSLRAEARRGRYEQQAAALPGAANQLNPLDDVLRAEAQAQARRALARMRSRQAELLFLRASGFSYQELASIFGVKRTSIGAMLVRAESAFRKHYVRLFGEKENL